MKNIDFFLILSVCLFSSAGFYSCQDEGSIDSRFIYFGNTEPYTRIGAVEFIIDSYNGTIYNAEPLPAGTDLKAMKMWFVSNHENEGVFVNGVKQQSGVSVNDFTSPVEYEVHTKNEIRRYTVTVNVSSSCSTQAGVKLEQLSLVTSVDNDESLWLSPSVKVSQVDLTITDPVRSVKLCLFEIDMTDPSIVIRPTMPDNGDQWGLQDMVSQAKAINNAGSVVLGAINGDLFDDENEGGTGEPKGIVCRDGIYLKDTFDDEVNGCFFGIRVDGKAALGNYTEYVIVKEKLVDAIGATNKLVIGNAPVEQTGISMANRTAAGMNLKDLKTLYFVVVEGIEGITLTELARMMTTLGVGHAVNLGGGNSSTFVIRDENNQFTALNRPDGPLYKVGNGLAIIYK